VGPRSPLRSSCRAAKAPARGLRPPSRLRPSFAAATTPEGAGRSSSLPFGWRIGRLVTPRARFRLVALSVEPLQSAGFYWNLLRKSKAYCFPAREQCALGPPLAPAGFTRWALAANSDYLWTCLTKVEHELTTDDALEREGCRDYCRAAVERLRGGRGQYGSLQCVGRAVANETGDRSCARCDPVPRCLFHRDEIAHRPEELVERTAGHRDRDGDEHSRGEFRLRTERDSDGRRCCWGGHEKTESTKGRTSAWRHSFQENCCIGNSFHPTWRAK